MKWSHHSSLLRHSMWKSYPKYGVLAQIWIIVGPLIISAVNYKHNYIYIHIYIYMTDILSIRQFTHFGSQISGIRSIIKGKTKWKTPELALSPTVNILSESAEAISYPEFNAKSLQSYLTLWNPMNCSLPGFSVYGILQARILKWVAKSSSRGSSPSRNQTHVSYISCIDKRVLYHRCHLGNTMTS